MSIDINYHPGQGFSIDDKMLEWGMDRESVQLLLGGSITVLNEHSTQGIISDIEPGIVSIGHSVIYKDYCGLLNYFELSYDGANKLAELEVYYGVNFLLDNVRLDFGMLFDEAVHCLQTLSTDGIYCDAHTYFSADLKLVISEAISSGGLRSGFCYVHCAKDKSCLTR